MRLLIRLTTGVKFPTEFEGETIAQLRAHLAEAHDTPATARLVYKGRILDADDSKKTLAAYKIEEGCTIFLVTAATSKASKASKASGTSTSTSTTASPVLPSPVVPSPAVPSPSPAAIGASAGGEGTTASAPTATRPAVPATGNRNNSSNSSNSNLIDELNHNPLVQSMLQQNPEFLTNLLQSQMDSNPALRQLADSNPLLREALQNPAVLRDMVQAATNPAARAALERGHDLSLAQLENTPGGFNMLRNLYDTMEGDSGISAGVGAAASSASVSNARNATASSSSSQSNNNSLAGAAGQAMPNPWESSSASINAPSNSSMGGMLDLNSIMMNTGGSGGMPDFSSMMQAMQQGSSQNGGFPGSADSDAMLQFLQQNPAVRQQMESQLTQNPGLVRQMLSQTPMGGMLTSLSDQQLVDMVRMSMNLDPALMQSLRRQGSTNSTTQPFVGNRNPFEGVPNLFGGILNPPGARRSSNPWLDPTASNPWATTTGEPTPSVVPPRATQSYTHQVEQMVAMGFDESSSLVALQRARGNLNRAVEHVLSSPSSSNSTAAAAAAATGGAAAAAATTEPDRPPEESKKDAETKDD